MLMTLPGTATLYQGDEIGQGLGPGGDPPFDRFGRDVFRHPMQWDAMPRGGFSTAEPWLPLTDPAERNVADQRADPNSLLHFWRELIKLRRELGSGFRIVDLDPSLVAYERGDMLVVINAGEDVQVVPPGEAVFATSDAVSQSRKLAPGDGALISPA
jgi:alpha-glucosidase